MVTTDLLTVQEAADALNASRALIYALFNSGELEYINIGKRGKRIERAELERYIDRHRRRGPIGQGSTSRWESQSDIEKPGTAGLSRKRATVSELKQLFDQKEKLDNLPPSRKAS